MTGPAFTAAPWKLGVRYADPGGNRDDVAGCYQDVDADGWGALARVVVRMEDEREDSADGTANARLIVTAPRLFNAICALGSVPEGYCFCSKDRVGDDSKVHEPECAELRAAIAEVLG